MATRRAKTPTKKKRIVIIGAALAGPTAAARAREIDETAEIVLLERNTRVSYAMTGLALHLSGEVKSLEDLNREREDFFREVYNVDVRTRTEVMSIDAKKKQLLLRQNSGEEILAYDKLIFATGASSVQPIGIDEADNFRFFRTLDDLAAIRASLDAGRKRFVVLGGGSMGAEALDGLVRGGADVTLLEKKAQFLPDYSPEIALTAMTALEHKVRILTAVKDITFEKKNGVITAVKADGIRIETDFVVSAIGVRPRTELLKKAGVKLLPDGSIPVNDRCQTNIKDIYACSICVSIPEDKDYRWIPQAAVSDKTAQVAAENAAGGSARLGPVTQSQHIRLPGIEIGRVGLTCAQTLRKYGKANIDSVFIHGRDKEAYMPGSAHLGLKLYYHKKKREVIALEVVGEEIKSRLDAFATALAGKLKLHDLALIDLAYTPPFGTARDALNVAATVALQKLEKLTTTVTYEEIRAKRKQYFVLDVSIQAKHAGFHDMHLPLERLRSSLEELRRKFKAARAKKVVTLSETGRRGHLAVRILSANGFAAANIMGGKRIG